MKKKKRICFDMDGTIVNFYQEKNWLEDLMAENPAPYKNAGSCLNLQELEKELKRLQKNYKLCIITWLSKYASKEFAKAIETAKRNWLLEHLSIDWDEIHIIPYGDVKNKYCYSISDILFDDEILNRELWSGQAYDETEILKILKAL